MDLGAVGELSSGLPAASSDSKDPSWGLVRNPPGVKQGPVLEVALLVHQQHVSVLGLAVADEGPVQDLDLHLGIGQLPGADRGQQRRAEAAQRGHQHAAAPQDPAERDGGSTLELRSS